MPADPDLSVLESLAGYRNSFMDADLWRSRVEGVCRKAGWECENIRAGVAGTFPTFLIDKKLVVKFFGRLFDGETCWQVEKEAAGLMKGVPGLPVARILASGRLDGERDWHYLIFEFIPGVSIGEVYKQVPRDEKLNLVRWLGKRLAEMHKLRPTEPSCLPRLSEDLMRGWFSARWDDEQEGWPTHLAAQVKGYIETNQAFIQAGSDLFIHADVTQDHVLGELRDGEWTTRGLIDLGDAMQGNLYYELAALHLDLFDCDKEILEAFLEAYGFPGDRDFARKAMVTSLLHQFGIYAHLFKWKPELCQAHSLEELSLILWDLRNE